MVTSKADLVRLDHAISKGLDRLGGYVTQLQNLQKLTDEALLAQNAIDEHIEATTDEESSKPVLEGVNLLLDSAKCVEQLLVVYSSSDSLEVSRNKLRHKQTARRYTTRLKSYSAKIEVLALSPTRNEGNSVEASTSIQIESETPTLDHLELIQKLHIHFEEAARFFEQISNSGSGSRHEGRNQNGRDISISITTESHLNSDEDALLLAASSESTCSCGPGAWYAIGGILLLLIVGAMIVRFMHLI